MNGGNGGTRCRVDMSVRVLPCVLTLQTSESTSCEAVSYLQRTGTTQMYGLASNDVAAIYSTVQALNTGFLVGVVGTARYTFQICRYPAKTCSCAIFRASTVVYPLVISTGLAWSQQKYYVCVYDFTALVLQSRSTGLQ